MIERHLQRQVGTIRWHFTVIVQPEPYIATVRVEEPKGPGIAIWQLVSISVLSSLCPSQANFQLADVRASDVFFDQTLD